MGELSNCLEPYNMYEEQVRFLDIHSDRHAIDLTCFFKDVFDCRDQKLGYPPYRRYTKKGKVTRFKFEFTDFVEAFIRFYEPDQIATFVESHLNMESEQSDVFLNRIRTAEEKYKLACLQEGNYGKRIYALNFSRKELMSRIRESWLDLTKKERYVEKHAIDHHREKYHCKEFWVSPRIKIGRKFNSVRLRTHLLNNMEDPILFLVYDDWGQRCPKVLHDINFIQRYSLPYEHLKVIKNP